MSALEMTDVSYAYPDEVDKFKTRNHRHVTVDDIPEAVSYTHLDVYKRQYVRFAGSLSLEQLQPSRQATSDRR